MYPRNERDSRYKCASKRIVNKTVASQRREKKLADIKLEKNAILLYMLVRIHNNNGNNIKFERYFPQMNFFSLH